MLTKDYKEAITQAIAIIDTDEDFKSKIPEKILDFFSNNASTTYQFTFDGDLQGASIKKETKGLLAILYRNYICTQEEKQDFDNILKNNQQAYEEEIREKYNPEKVFDNSKNSLKEELKNDYTAIPEDITTEEMNTDDIKSNSVDAPDITDNTDDSNDLLIVQKENIFKCIFNKIKSFFKK